jgi:hypothetical protein
MFRYESKTDKWIDEPLMKHSRRMASYVILNKRIYAFGGYDENNALCEVYNIDKRQ